jgi:cytoskeleton protein RodZ
MSELDLSLASSSEGSGIVNESRVESAGALIKAARERCGLHIAALAVSLKVPVKRLDALEADQWDSFPDAVFVRALASSVCRSLKIDPVPVLARLPRAAAQSPLVSSKGINAPLISPGIAASSSALDQLSKPVVLTGLALLAGALVLIFFPDMSRIEEVVANSTQAVFPPVPTTDSVSTPSADPIVDKDSGNDPVLPTVLATTTPALATASANVTGTAIFSNVGSISASPGVELVKPASSLTEVATLGLLIVKSRGTSWVEVTDAKGVVQLRRILESGELVDVAGALPLAVVVGRADVIDVQLRGKPFDLQAVTKSNVARFEVK